MRASTEERAKADPLNHSIDDKGRVWEHPEKLSRGGYTRDPVRSIPHPPADGSAHILRSPTHVRDTFTWVAGLGESGVWLPAGPMRRLAYEPDHLGTLGWVYERPVNMPGPMTQGPEKSRRIPSSPPGEEEASRPEEKAADGQ